jgi:tetratricopeptide (TPR) repeat protein
MSKSMLVTTPFLLLLLDYWPLRRITKFGWKSVRSLIIEKTPFFVLSAVSCIVTFFVQRSGGAVVATATVPMVARVENVFISFARYLEKLFWPRDLSIYYPHPWGAWPAWQVNSAYLLIAGISVAALLVRKKYAPAFVGWFWFVGTLVPVIGIIQVGTQTMADRYMYFPAIGILLLVVWSCSDLARDWLGCRWILGAAGVSVLICCATLTIRQLGYWRNSEQLFQHAAASGYDCDFVELYLAAALGARGANEEALAHIQNAERLNPSDGYTRMYVSFHLDRLGRVEEALTKVGEAIALTPNLARAYFFRGLYLEKLNRPEQAITAYQNAVERDGLEELKFARYNLGVLLEHVGRIEEAIAQYQGELRVNPRYLEAYNNLGRALLAKERPPDAEKQFRAAIRIQPNFAEAHNNLGGALYLQGKRKEAITEFREALRLRPDYDDARKNLDNIVAGDDSK